MDDFNDFDSPLHLDGDGDDAVEMCLFFDEDGKRKGNSNQPHSNSGCCVVLLAFGGVAATMIWSITEILI